MSEKHNIFHGQFVKNIYGELVPATTADATRYGEFKKGIIDGQTIEIFMESNVDNGSVPQLAKIHVCIRELAKELGYSFEDMKLEVKRQAGLCVKKHLGGDTFMVCKSFGDCSKDELALAIEAIIEIGDTVGMNLR